ncbi:MAG: Cys-tRNA(Pro) deacylase [Synergistaceae bacterium]|jgi:Cys-tRNA(Pro)/Cys-tRNA(Cys) deacylase|nr:Cys-tRNA(Pro) deacylase [Synergistaceae bacterium]
MGKSETNKNKTNVSRILDKLGIAYSSHSYDGSDGKFDGVSVALKIGRPVEMIYKTLILQGTDGEYYVFVVPGAEKIDLKLAAKAVGVKSIDMLPVTDINAVTGYIRGGCSPVGMKKRYPTVLDASCLKLERMIVSAGKIGAQVELAPADLIRATDARVAAVTEKASKELVAASEKQR